MISRRCLICANINPCREHSEAEQEAELARNDAAIEALRAAPARSTDVSDEGPGITSVNSPPPLPRLGDGG